MFVAALAGEVDLPLAFAGGGALGGGELIVARGAGDSSFVAGVFAFGWGEGGAAAAAEDQGSGFEPVDNTDPLVEDKAFAFPERFGRVDGFEVFEDPAAEVVDLAEASFFHESGRLFAADPAGAIHGDLGGLRGVEVGIDVVGEFAEGIGLRIDCPVKLPDANLVGVPGIDDGDLWIGDKGIPILRCDIGADFVDGGYRGVADCNDFLFEPNLHSIERPFGGMGPLDLDRAGRGEGSEFSGQGGEVGGIAGNGSVKALGGEEEGAGNAVVDAELLEIVAVVAEGGKVEELIKGSDRKGCFGIGGRERFRGHGKKGKRPVLRSASFGGSSPRLAGLRKAEMGLASAPQSFVARRSEVGSDLYQSEDSWGRKLRRMWSWADSRSSTTRKRPRSSGEMVPHSTRVEKLITLFQKSAP